MEVDIDVGSSSVAATVVNLVQGATKSLVVDMGIVLEGHASEELPESLLGTVSAASWHLQSCKHGLGRLSESCVLACAREWTGLRQSASLHCHKSRD